MTEQPSETSIKPETPEDAAGEAEAKELLRRLDARCPFGPAFFLSQLSDLIRDRCPEAAEALPLVELHLVDGTTLCVCHVMGLSPSWLALAVYDERSRDPEMRTELVPYSAILRVSIRPGRPGAHRIGFEQGRQPALVAQAPEPKP